MSDRTKIRIEGWAIIVGGVLLIVFAVLPVLRLVKW